MKTRFTMMALGALASLGLFATASGASSSSKQRVDLQPTGVDADASGRARFKLRSSDTGQLDVEVRHLAAGATYQIVADDVRVGEIVTSNGGKGRIRLRSRPRSSRDQLLGFDPRGATLLVRDADGHDVLAGMLPAGSSSSGDVICCIPDDSGSECEDRTTEECAAAGGTVSSASSCLPNPCEGTPPPSDADVICCIPDDSGTECEDRTPDECARQGGTVVEGTSCQPNPCAAIPPADDDIRCCLPDDSGAECEDRTPAECQAQGGVDLGAGSCTPNPCGDVNPPPPPGGGTASVRVRCELRSSRSKASVDGSGLAPGSYSARLTSGANQAVSGLQAAVGDEAEFDFDSDGGDIAAGATPIAASFLQGNPPQARGQILDSGGNVVAEALVTCDVR